MLVALMCRPMPLPTRSGRQGHGLDQHVLPAEVLGDAHSPDGGEQLVVVLAAELLCRISND